MNGKVWPGWLSCLMALAIANVLTASVSFGLEEVAAEEEEAVEEAEAMGGRFQINEATIIQNVFGSQNSVESARRKSENVLKLHIDFVELSGKLPESQRTKLQLAGQGDIERFFNDFALMKAKCPTGNLTQEQWNEAWQKLQPFSSRYSAGLHGRGSLFRRTIPSALGPEQEKKYEQLVEERNRRHYAAMVGATLTLIDHQIPLTAEQRKKLTELIMAKTEPPTHYGQSYYQLYVVLERMTHIPEEELKPIFLDNEWKVMQGILQQGRAMEHTIKQMEKEGDEEVPS